MKFQLLVGQHEDENGARYEASVVRNDKGETIKNIQPVIDSDVDLVKCFGPEKFRRLSDEQANLILLPEKKVSGTAVINAPLPDISGNFAGRDVSKDFPDAERLSLRVFFRGRDDYRVYDGADGKELTQGSLKRKEVQPFIEKYMEG